MIILIRNLKQFGLTDTVYPKMQMLQSPLLKGISSRNSEESGTKRNGVFNFEYTLRAEKVYLF